MRIYGGHDYYDCGLSLGIDPNIVLVRNKSKHVPVEQAGGSLLDQTLRAPWGSPDPIADCYAVAFCNRVFRGVTLSHPKGGPLHFWSADKLLQYIQLVGVRLEMEFVPSHVKFGQLYRKIDRDRGIREWFEPAATATDLRGWMIRNKASILVERTNDPYRCRNNQVFEVNPTGLKQIGFAKALDPFTAFQELSMWIGGVLGGTSPEIATITDDQVLIENHGFDKVASFRGPRL